MIVSVHEYELAEGVSADAFLGAVEAAIARDLFALPGLVEYRFGRGIRGARTDRFVAVWTYESEEAWAALWGPVDDPVSPEAYPASWRVWEEELLDPLLSGDPDDIAYTTYDVVAR